MAPHPAVGWGPAEGRGSRPVRQERGNVAQAQGLQRRQAETADRFRTVPERGGAAIAVIIGVRRPRRYPRNPK